MGDTGDPIPHSPAPDPGVPRGAQSPRGTPGTPFPHSPAPDPSVPRGAQSLAPFPPFPLPSPSRVPKTNKLGTEILFREIQLRNNFNPIIRNWSWNYRGCWRQKATSQHCPGGCWGGLGRWGGTPRRDLKEGRGRLTFGGNEGRTPLTLTLLGQKRVSLGREGPGPLPP